MPMDHRFHPCKSHQMHSHWSQHILENFRLNLIRFQAQGSILQSQKPGLYKYQAKAFMDYQPWITTNLKGTLTSNQIKSFIIVRYLYIQSCTFNKPLHFQSLFNYLLRHCTSKLLHQSWWNINNQRLKSTNPQKWNWITNV